MKSYAPAPVLTAIRDERTVLILGPADSRREVVITKDGGRTLLTVSEKNPLSVQLAHDGSIPEFHATSVERVLVHYEIDEAECQDAGFSDTVIQPEERHRLLAELKAKVLNICELNGVKVPPEGPTVFDGSSALMFAEKADAKAYSAVRNAKAVYEKRMVVQHEPVRFAVTEKVPEEPFITPGRFVGEDVSSAFGRYYRSSHIKALIGDFLQRHNLQDNPAYKVLHLSASGEISITFPGGFCRRYCARDIRDRIDVLREFKARVTRELHELDAWYREYHHPVNVAEMRVILENIRRDLGRLNIKQSSQNDHNRLMTYVSGQLAGLDASPG
ncbi:hypothetical protein AD929_03210 [Gluconobacter potus]|uniref:Uncharacterized protein n=1 Tax=Gluconobacter potus TaxID=2724927 RepID=A0A149QYC1_9PROT|nr:hypothetical protein [Gluconobacter potus]KXV02302.1 hypothetical protein AD929_03210 [Gluconobacter potus]